MTKVSISIPFYNVYSNEQGESWARQCIRSVLDQTHEEFELILIDDGSTDETIELLSEYTDDGRTRLIKQENRGFPGARNRGIEEGEGDYYAFIGQDDLWDSKKLERQIAYLESTDDDIVHTNALHIDENGEIIGRRHNDDPPLQTHRKMFIRELFMHSFICIQSVLANTKVFEEHRFDESLSINCDHELWLRLAGEFNFGYMPDEIVYKRFHGSNVSGRYETLFEERKCMIEKMVKRYPFLGDLRNQKLSQVYLTYAVRLIVDGEVDRGRKALRQSITYNGMNWKAFATYVLSLAGPTIGGEVVNRLSKPP
jgi:glycosyltransferase involved in cell wall biosynthesis